MSTEGRSRRFQELANNLRYEGFTVKPETADGLLPVELDGQLLCHVTEAGGVQYRKRDVLGDDRDKAKDRVFDIAQITAGYMQQMEAAPQLTGVGLTGDYRLLAEFNGIVLAGHPTKYGVQFVTWEWVRNHTALNQGNYYGPEGGTDSYTAAKRNFATRSGLIPRSALFDQKQLIEIYHCSTETLAGTYPITDEQEKCLRSIIDQIECSIPNLGEFLNQEQKLDASEAPENGGMQFS